MATVLLMIPTAVALGLAAAVWVPVATATTFAGPAPNLLFQLQKQNLAHPLLRVTADDVRREVRVTVIDEQGLEGLQARAPDSPLPRSIAWRSIGRIDEIVTRAARDRTRGFLLGAATGAVVGGRHGERDAHERNGYVGTPASPSGDPLATVAEAQGDFGEFEGYAAAIGPEGMEGLRALPDQAGRPTSMVPAGRVTWDRIDELDKRWHGWRKGALVGAVLLGTVGGLLGYAETTAGLFETHSPYPPLRVLGGVVGGIA